MVRELVVCCVKIKPRSKPLVCLACKIRVTGSVDAPCGAITHHSPDLSEVLTLPRLRIKVVLVGVH